MNTSTNPSSPSVVTRSSSETQHHEEKPKTSLLLKVYDQPGALQEILKYFWKHEINMTRIESRPAKSKSKSSKSIHDNPDMHSLYSFLIDHDGLPQEALLSDLEGHCSSVLVMNEKYVPWFPIHIKDLDLSVGQTVQAETNDNKTTANDVDLLESDHPGFKDPVYRERRTALTQAALIYRQGQEIPTIDYSKEEVETWGTVYGRMEALWKKYACKEFQYILPLLQSNCGYARDNIPQQQDISEFLKSCTGFRLHPVAGLLSARDFLNGLAHRVFFSTQYIRHHSKPLYTPEPDICHELLGHAPMFADPDFADFSHEIGLASLGASDEEIMKLATCYWFSVEFGLCKEDGKKKAYGAGLLSSFGELEYACDPTRPAGGESHFPEYRPWDPVMACKQEYPITTYQPIYYVAESLVDAKDRMRDFCAQLNRPFYARYNPYSQTVSVDRAVAREGKILTP